MKSDCSVPLQIPPVHWIVAAYATLLAATKAAAIAATSNIARLLAIRPYLLLVSFGPPPAGRSVFFCAPSLTRGVRGEHPHYPHTTPTVGSVGVVPTGSEDPLEDAGVLG